MLAMYSFIICDRVLNFLFKKRKHMDCVLSCFRGSQTFLAYGFLSVWVTFPTPLWQMPPVCPGTHSPEPSCSPGTLLQSPGDSHRLPGVGTQNETYLSSRGQGEAGGLKLGWGRDEEFRGCQARGIQKTCLYFRLSWQNDWWFFLCGIIVIDIDLWLLLFVFSP